jgi:hypothetical protein
VVKKEKERGGRGGEKRKKHRKEFPENMGKRGKPGASLYVRGGYAFPCFLQDLRPHGKDGKKRGRGEERGERRGKGGEGSAGYKKEAPFVRGRGACGCGTFHTLAP